MRSVFKGVPIRGCAFHWSQAVWRKVQELGLRTAYCENGAVHQFIRRVLDLLFLPAEHIAPAFNELRKLTKHSQLMQLLLYVEATCLSSSVWHVAVWSIYDRAIRTNNDVEGWHHRMNSRAGHNKMHFYSLIHFLHEEAKLVPVYALLVSEGKLTRLQQKSQLLLQKKIFTLWREYKDGKKDSVPAAPRLWQNLRPSVKIPPKGESFLCQLTWYFPLKTSRLYGQHCI